MKINELRKFFEFYGPLDEGEVTAVVLLARKKYAPELLKSERTIDYLLLRGPMDVETMERFTRVFIEKYTRGPVFTKSGFEVPPHALSFSILTSPVLKRHVAKRYTVKVVTQSLDEQYDTILNAKWQLLSAIMETKGKRHILFDIDVPGKEGLDIAKEIAENLPGPNLLIETHGGYHLLMKRGEWLRGLANYKPPKEVEWKNIVMTALPETPRGGKIVRIVGGV